jgi:ribonuclease HII
MTHTQYIVGVDEIGRGPLAGPVAVCAVVVPEDFDFSVFPHLTDSKKLSHKRREVIFEKALALQYEGKLRFAIHYSSPEMIDKEGIETAVDRAVDGVLYTLGTMPRDIRVKLDGRLKTSHMLNQESIIRGDETVPVISLASVIGKVARDRVMDDYCAQYPAYRFSNNKGYGTKQHVEAIKEHGTSPIHRNSYLSRIIEDDTDTAR